MPRTRSALFSAAFSSVLDRHCPFFLMLSPTSFRSFRLVAFLGPPLGSVITGALLQTLGTTPTIVIYTALLVLVSLATTFNKHLHQAP